MHYALSNLLSLALASAGVGAVWALASTVTAGSSLADFLSGWMIISSIVFGIVLLPAALLIFASTRRGSASFGLSVCAAALLGAVLFVVFFVRWAGENRLADLATLLGYGGGLGAVGGAVYWWSIQKFKRQTAVQQ